MNSSYFPQKLPKCEYPNASDFANHGLLPLPTALAAISWEAVEQYRSQHYPIRTLEQLSNKLILEVAKIVAEAFAKNEPMKKHLKPPKVMPENIKNSIHVDFLGQDTFGEWSAANIVYWFIRLLILTNPTDPIANIGKNISANNLSLAMFDDDTFELVGGAFNTIVPYETALFRDGDPFLDAILCADKPIVELLFEQEHAALEALKEQYTSFKTALKEEKVGLHFMVAKVAHLPTEYAFELVAASARHFYECGFEYMVTCASNQWTGAACEVLNGVRVHFSPYRTIQRVDNSLTVSLHAAHSEDGYISKKDSGAMFYVIKLRSS